MNITEYLLTCLNEECLEIAKNVTKSLRFGILDIGPKNKVCNLEALGQELDDLEGVLELLADSGINIEKYRNRDQIEAKKLKVKKYMEYSKKQGLLT